MTSKDPIRSCEHLETVTVTDLSGRTVTGFVPDIGAVTHEESRARMSEDRLLVICDRVWFAPITNASCLMIETRSPFATVSGFHAELWLGEQIFIAELSFASAFTVRDDPLTIMQFRATKLTPVPTGFRSLPVPRLVLSGPDLPRSVQP